MEGQGPHTELRSRSTPKSIVQKLEILFAQGGMMNVGYATLLGKEIPLLSPVTLSPNETIHLYYNYFDDSFYGDTVYCSRNNNFETEDIGNRAFARVIRAGTLLCGSRVQSLEFNPSEDLGWINFLFGSRASNPWKQYSTAAADTKKTDMIDQIWMSGPTRRFLKEDCLHPDFQENPRINPGFPESDYMPKFILRNAQETIHAIHLSSGTHSEKIGFIVHALQSDAVKTKGKPPCYQQFITICDVLPTECIVPLVNAEFQCDITHLLAASSLRTFSIYEEATHSLKNGISTSAFLNVSDDDRAYFWRPNGDVEFSDQMIVWFRNTKRMYDDILFSSENCLAYEEAVWTFFCALEKLDRNFNGLYCFKNFFLEYLNHACDRTYQAALALLLRMIDDAAFSEADETKQYSVRKYLKRYLAVLGNSCLRERVFGF